jgi:hypothetical protein
MHAAQARPRPSGALKSMVSQSWALAHGSADSVGERPQRCAGGAITDVDERSKSPGR